MAVTSIGEYKFPSRSREELYGDDQLVHVWWRDNQFICAAATFRAPKAIPFGTFLAEIVGPWASSDPDFDPSAIRDWWLDGNPIQVSDDKSLKDLGIGHKHTLSFQTN